TPGRPAPALRSQRGLMIFFNHSPDSGQTWLSHDLRLSEDQRPSALGAGTKSGTTAGGADSGGDASDGKGATPRRERNRGFIRAQPRIQADPRGRVFVAWMDNRGGLTEIYFRASTDHGQSWGPEINVSRGASSAREHQLLTDGQGRVFLAWTDSRDGKPDVFFARSEDGGATWAAPVRVSHRAVGATSSISPNMAIGPDGRLYVAWQDQRNGRDDIYLNVSADRGQSWLGQDIRLDRDDAGTGISRSPQVVVGGPGTVAVIWEDDRAAFEQLLLNLSTDG